MTSLLSLCPKPPGCRRSPSWQPPLARTSNQPPIDNQPNLNECVGRVVNISRKRLRLKLIVNMLYSLWNFNPRRRWVGTEDMVNWFRSLSKLISRLAITSTNSPTQPACPCGNWFLSGICSRRLSSKSRIFRDSFGGSVIRNTRNSPTIFVRKSSHTRLHGKSHWFWLWNPSGEYQLQEVGNNKILH
jgi:hypothetical protein